jgi:hypothetical protein
MPNVESHIALVLLDNLKDQALKLAMIPTQEYAKQGEGGNVERR